MQGLLNISEAMSIALHTCVWLAGSSEQAFPIRKISETLGFSQNHMAKVVQQLVHAIIEQGVKVNVVAYQSIVHAFIHMDRILPLHSKGITDNGIEYDIYRPYTFTTGNRDFKLINWINKKISN